jgi:cytochrome c oxidase cbb3-type subunit 2
MTRTLLPTLPLLLWAPGAWADDLGPSVYRGSCAPCHGARGDGRGPAARFFDPPPRDFTRGNMKLRSTPSGSLPTRADLVRVIAEGMPGTAMPGWRGKLSLARIEAVAATVEGFLPRAAPRGEAQIVPSAPPGSPALVHEGRVLYRVLKCWTCHGTAGRGDGPASRDMVDDRQRPIRPSDLTAPLRCGSTAEAIYRVLVTGMDGTPMPSFADAVGVGREAFADLTPYRGMFDPAAQAEILRHVATLPTSDELEALPPPRLRALVERRLWALATYVATLRRPRGIVDYLFLDQASRLPLDQFDPRQFTAWHPETR